ncbi:MAG TPA: hypothetical protein VIO13_04270 [Candidatus Dormibacteraeota bacterium]|jgi:hypothetical protein
MPPVRSTAILAVAALALTACASTQSAAATSRPLVSHSPAPTPTHGATPTATPAPTGPFALLATNNNRQGSTYDVLLVDEAGHIVARVTAKLPLLKPHQTITIPLANATTSGAYYLDGDTDIHTLNPDGSAPVLKTIAAGTASTLAFAVSPDGQRVAVSVITEQSVGTRTTGHGYIEDLRDANGHVDIFSNTAVAAYRWPIAWHANNVVDAIGSANCGNYGYGSGTNSIACAQSLHVINATTQSRAATICEQPAAAASGESYSWSLTGLLTRAGAVCNESEYNSPDGANTCAIAAVDLNGIHHSFMSSPCAQINGNLSLTNCFLSPDGTRMACQSSSNFALVFLSSSGATHNLGRRYNVLGWIDASHLMVQVDTTTLAVLQADTGAVTNVTLTGADQVTMDGVAG